MEVEGVVVTVVDVEVVVAVDVDVDGVGVLTDEIVDVEDAAEMYILRQTRRKVTILEQDLIEKCEPFKYISIEHAYVFVAYVSLETYTFASWRCFEKSTTPRKLVTMWFESFETVLKQMRWTAAWILVC